MSRNKREFGQVSRLIKDHRFIDLTGTRYNMLTVVSFWGRENKTTYWNCICDCGNETVVASMKIRSGHTQSCGCLNSKRTSEANSTHHLYKHPLYNTWVRMNQRCSENLGYHTYLAKGISIHPDWRMDNPNGCKNFINYVETVLGPKPDEHYESGRPKYSIDRIDNHGDYTPDNIRWATQSEQNLNRG